MFDNMHLYNTVSNRIGHVDDYLRQLEDDGKIEFTDFYHRLNF